MSTNESGQAWDGVICFGGEDWWYHNRGHFDMQLMREISASAPVLYVNSIGMRVPKIGEGSMFLTRVRRKLRSVRRGLVTVRENFSVYSPLVVPGRLGHAIGDAMLARQVDWAARRVGIRRPLVWIACPPAARALKRMDPAGVVYQRTDRLEHYQGVNIEEISSYDQELKQRADLTLFCSAPLMSEEHEQCRRALYVDHGVDYDRFVAADGAPDPSDVQDIPHPRVGFVGGIDAHTFDPEFFLAVVRQLPEMQFVMTGACSLPEGWCTESNVHFLGRKPYDDVPGYMASSDVLIMPWNRNDWIEACNPVKLKEYLATGRPVVTTPFAELRNYDGLVHVADNATSFAAAIRTALAEKCDVARQRARVEPESWTARGESVLRELERHGLPFERSANVVGSMAHTGAAA